MTVSNFHSFCQHVLTENAARMRACPRARTSSTASASCSSCETSAQASTSRYHTRLRVPGLRPVHQPGEGRAGGPGRLRPLRRGGAPGLRGPVTAASRAPRTPRDPGQPRAAAQGPRAPTRACAPTSAPRTPARIRDYDARAPTRPPTARPAARSPATGHAHWPQPVRARRPPADRRPRRRPTSATAPPSRSCA